MRDARPDRWLCAYLRLAIASLVVRRPPERQPPMPSRGYPVFFTTSARIAHRLRYVSLRECLPHKGHKRPLPSQASHVPRFSRHKYAGRLGALPLPRLGFAYLSRSDVWLKERADHTMVRALVKRLFRARPGWPMPAGTSTIAYPYQPCHFVSPYPIRKLILIRVKMSLL